MMRGQRYRVQGPRFKVQSRRGLLEWLVDETGERGVLIAEAQPYHLYVWMYVCMHALCIMYVRMHARMHEGRVLQHPR